MNHSQSNTNFKQAQSVIPGGVDSPVRAFASVGGSPVFADHAKGALLTDSDDNTYIDYICSWGPLILGHASPVYYDGVMEVIQGGTTFGLPTAPETKLAELIVEAVASIEKVRFVNSGTEAVMSAIRLARGYTNRDKIIKFEGCYHGHSDAMLVKSGSGALTYGKPSSAGVPVGAAADTLTATYNDLDSVRALFEENANEVAAVIVEPVGGNMGVVPPQPGFLEGLRALCTQYGALLIFDEVITGFRTAFGGMQELTGIQADLTTFGKIIGAGMPVGAFGGRDDIMAMLAPEGPVYQAGTLSGNPVAMHMGKNLLTYLQAHNEVYTHMEALAIQLQKGLTQAASEAGVPVSVNRFGGMSALFFTDENPTDFNSVMKSDTSAYAQFFNGMLERGILFPPSQYEGLFLSAAHTTEHIQQTIDAAREVFINMKKGEE